MPIISSLVLVAATVLLFLTAWIVIPGWTYPIFNLSVGAPEISLWLVLGGLIVCAAALAMRGGTRLAHVTFVVALCAVVLASIPITRAPFAIQRFDAEMKRALGGNFLAGVPAPILRGMRERPVSIVALFRGVDFGSARIDTDVPFAAPNGQRLTLAVYRPRGAGRFPAVVQIYGGAWQRGSPNDFSNVARYLASRGYVVFSIDYRHAPQWTWPAQLDDVRAALAWIRAYGKDYDADVSRMVMMGRSAGAHLALLAAYEPGAPPIRGVISYYGPTDLIEGFRNPPRPDPLDVRATDEAFLGGTPDSVPARYRAASPLTYVTRPLPPTLLIYGARDHVVEARFGRALHERLLATGTPSVFLEIPWAEHAFDVDFLKSGLSAQLSLYYTERFLAWCLTRF